MYSPILPVVSNIMQKKNEKKTWSQQRNKAYAKREKSGIRGPAQNLGMAGGAIAGGFVGGPYGAAIGASMGDAIGKGIGYITGSGDYRVAPGRGVPSFSKNECTTITHRSYITDITSSSVAGAFSIQKYAINPGLSGSFPWLAAIATNYEEYEFDGLVYEFVSTSGDSVGSTTTSLGTVILATQYDPTKPNFDTKQGMENYSFSQSAKPSCSILHAVECKKNLSPVKCLYVRSGNNTSDLRWTDFGNFYIATVGMQAASVTLGELWVSFKVKLRKPRLPQTVGIAGRIASATLYNTNSTTLSPAGTGSLTTGLINITAANGLITWNAIPQSYYIVTVRMTATNVILTGWAMGPNTAQAARFQNASSVEITTPQNATTQITSQCIQCTATSGNEVNCQVLVPGTITGAGTALIVITQVDDDFGL